MLIAMKVGFFSLMSAAQVSGQSDSGRIIGSVPIGIVGLSRSEPRWPDCRDRDGTERTGEGWAERGFHPRNREMGYDPEQSTY